MLTRLANPVRFERFAKVAEPIAGVLALILLPLALWFALIQSPAAEEHEETVRILYVHVASAWSMMAGYMGLAVASFVYFVWRHSLADVAARAIAIPGVVMTALCLITGSLWGKPAWDTWWQWDGRMTSVLLLFFIYLGYFAMRALDEDTQKSALLAAILAMVGAVNIPIIKFSVDWWVGLHQPATLSSPGSPGLAGPLLTPLLLMLAAYTAIFTWFVLHEMREELRQRATQRRFRKPNTVHVETVTS